MIESVLIGIFANLVTDFGKETLRNVIKRNELNNEIEIAFNNALIKWSNNYQIREREKIFTKDRSSTLIECIKSPEKINNLDKGTSDLIMLFKTELQKNELTWNFIQDVQFQESLNRINSLDLHLKELGKSLISYLDRIEKHFLDGLVSPEVAFNKQLNPDVDGLFYQFSNKFIGRKNDLAELDYLIKLSPYKVISIVANGGLGKTRLCIEYFENYANKDQEINCWVLNPITYDHLNSTTKFDNDKANIVLLDDAHKSPQALNEIIKIINQYDNVKLLITVRKSSYGDTIEAIGSHNRNIVSHELTRLTYEETKALFKSQLPWVDEKEIRRLAEQSRGIPIVILGLCEVKKKGKYKTQLTEDENFKLFVLEIKKQVIKEVHNTTYLEKDKINKIIESLSFFGPLKAQEIEVLSTINEINVVDTNKILDQLEELDFISKGHEIFIKPEIYSDTILVGSSSRIQYLFLKDITVFKDRLLRNLMEVEESNRLNFNIDNILFEFISSFNDRSLESHEDFIELEVNLNTLKTFTYKKPKICFTAIKNLIASQLSNYKFWEINIEINQYSKLLDVHKSIDDIISIVALNAQTNSELDSIYTTLLNYSKLIRSTRIFKSVFRFRIYDFEEYGYQNTLSYKRQIFLIQKLYSRVENETISSDLCDHIIECCSILLDKEFEGDNFYDRFSNTFTWRRHHVIFNDNTRNIRLDAIRLLILVYSENRDSSCAKKCLENIVLILFYMIKTRNENYIFNQDHELKVVLDFLDQILQNNPTIFDRSSILRQIKLFKRKEIKEEYRDIAEKLVSLAEKVEKPRNKLELLFHDDYSFVRREKSNLLANIIKEYKNDDEFLDDFLSIYLGLVKGSPTNFQEILSELINGYPAKSKLLLNLIIDKLPEKICDFTRLIRANYKDQEYFYDTINTIWNMDFDCVPGAVIWMLTYGRNQNHELYQKVDLEYFDFIVRNKLIKSLWSSVFTLPKYLHIDSQETIKLISEVLNLLDKSRERDHLISALFEDETLVKENKDLIKDLIFKETPTIPLDNGSFNKALIFLDNYYGYKVLLDYIKLRVQCAEKDNQLLGFSFTRNYHNPSKSSVEVELDYLKAIEWYASLRGKNEYIHKAALEFLRPNKLNSDEFREKFTQLILESTNDKDKSIALFEGLDVYEFKGKYIITLIIECMNQILDKIEFSKPDIIRIFGDKFVYNLGLRSGVTGQPFPQDIRKKELLDFCFEKFDLHSKINEVLMSTMERVISSINEDPFDDKEIW